MKSTAFTVASLPNRCEGEPTKVKEFLPKKKQFLLTRSVPCSMRATALLSSEIEQQAEAEEGWNIPELKSSSSLLAAQKIAHQEAEEYLDMDEDEQGLGLDDAVTKPKEFVSSSGSASNAISRCRRYVTTVT